MGAKTTRHDKFLTLREEFPVFIYENFDLVLDDKGLACTFRFRLGDRHSFTPSFFIPRKPWFLPDEEILPLLPALVFHIGMIELLSYWKAACSPVVEVRAGGLTNGQKEWWKGLVYHGLGEFLHVNGIVADPVTLVNFKTTEISKKIQRPQREGTGILIPVGGGKDSAVTLELLGPLPGSLPLVLNPAKAAWECIRQSGISSQESDVVEIRRTLDPLLLKLNGEGFLNGHTPFSALLGFYTVLAAAMAGKKYIALSNESSANEPTIPGTRINHQYSKSFEFESGFRRYVKEFLSEDVDYFSFLRPLHEIQIARLFSRYRTYHEVFRSCNAGSKTGAWCGKCPKCLFTCIILSPFLSEEELVRIFGHDLLNDSDLLPYFEQLTGVSPEKPFDCVGTVDEVNAAIRATIDRRPTGSLPFLLNSYRMQDTGRQDQGALQRFLDSFDRQHHIPTHLLPVLTDALNG